MPGAHHAALISFETPAYQQPSCQSLPAFIRRFMPPSENGKIFQKYRFFISRRHTVHFHFSGAECRTDDTSLEAMMTPLRRRPP